MAGAITHIVIAEKLHDKYFSDKDKRLFFLGSVFPDIRYWGVIDRDKTHFYGLSFGTVLAESDSFLAGMKFHSIVDEVREEFMKEKEMYSLFDNSELRGVAVKTYEDRLLYSKIKDWGVIYDMFDEISEDELDFGIDREVVLSYHNYMKAYFLKGPDRDMIYRSYVEELGRPLEMPEELIRVMESVTDNDRADQVVNEFYERFEELIA